MVTVKEVVLDGPNPSNASTVTVLVCGPGGVWLFTKITRLLDSPCEVSTGFGEIMKFNLLSGGTTEEILKETRPS
jgi:hypothetical protein